MENPDILNVKPISHPDSMSISTSILDPVVISDSFCRFNLEKRGLLHSNSKIQLGFKKTGANADTVTLPASIGCESLVQRCVLSCNSRILVDTSDFNHLRAYENVFQPAERMVEVDRVMSGKCHAFQQIKHPALSGTLLTTGAEEETSIFLDNGKDLDIALSNVLLWSKSEVKPHDNQIVRNNSTYSLNISDLFKVLRVHELPLFLIDGNINIELYFQPTQALRFSDIGSVAVNAYEIDNSQIKFIADYITYPEPVMNKMRNQKRTVMPFLDYQLVTGQNNYSTNPSYIRNLGGSGKIVSKVIVSNVITSVGGTAIDFSTKINNQYVSNDIGPINYNFKVNDELIYPVDISNTAQLFTKTLSAQGMPLNTIGGDYKVADFGSPYSPTGTYGDIIQASIQGNRNYFASEMPNNPRVNNRGLELHTSMVGSVNQVVTQRVWLEIAKFLVLENGVFDVQFA